MSLLPPTSVLPPIGKLSSCSPDSILEALQYLRLVYNPPVRGSRRKRSSIASDTGFLNSLRKGLVHPDGHSQLDLDVIRSDAFERAYAIRWLTALIARSNDVSDMDSESLSLSLIQHELLLAEAAALLAVCAGTAAAGSLTRIFAFGPVPAVEVRLTDVPLENADFASVGAQTWGGACVLAERIVEFPPEFGITVGAGCAADAGTGLRVLELGAGTGLVGITTGKLLEGSPEWCPNGATVIATDFYPSVLANLRTNIAANFPAAVSGLVSVSAAFLDWSELASQPATKELIAPFDQPFDLVLGADIVYEEKHALWLKVCLEKLLRPSPSALFHLVIPLRATHAVESSTIEQVFLDAEEMRGRTPAQLGILSKESIVCDAHETGDEDVEYAYYRIGWCL